MSIWTASRHSRKYICLGFCREPEIPDLKKLSCWIKVQWCEHLKIKSNSVRSSPSVENCTRPSLKWAGFAPGWTRHCEWIERLDNLAALLLNLMTENREKKLRKCEHRRDKYVNKYTVKICRNCSGEWLLPSQCWNHRWFDEIVI